MRGSLQAVEAGSGGRRTRLSRKGAAGCKRTPANLSFVQSCCAKGWRRCGSEQAPGAAVHQPALALGTLDWQQRRGKASGGSRGRVESSTTGPRAAALSREQAAACTHHRPDTASIPDHFGSRSALTSQRQPSSHAGTPALMLAAQPRSRLARQRAQGGRQLRHGRVLQQWMGSVGGLDERGTAPCCGRPRCISQAAERGAPAAAA